MYQIKHTPAENQKFIRREFWQVVRPNNCVLGPRFQTKEEAQIFCDELNALLKLSYER